MIKKPTGIVEEDQWRIPDEILRDLMWSNIEDILEEAEIPYTDEELERLVDNAMKEDFS